MGACQNLKALTENRIPESWELFLKACGPLFPPIPSAVRFLLNPKKSWLVRQLTSFPNRSDMFCLQSESKHTPAGTQKQYQGPVDS